MRLIPSQEMEIKIGRRTKKAYGQSKEPMPKNFPKTYMKVMLKEVS
jgi:hypothetical protein